MLAFTTKTAFVIERCILFHSMPLSRTPVGGSFLKLSYIWQEKLSIRSIVLTNLKIIIDKKYAIRTENTLSFWELKNADYKLNSYPR